MYQTFSRFFLSLTTRVVGLSVLIACGVCAASDEVPAFVESFEKPHPHIRWRAGRGERPGGDARVEVRDGAGFGGTHGLVWHYDFTDVNLGPGVYVRCRPDFILPGVPTRMSFRLLGNTSNLPISLRLSDATGRVWQQRIARLDVDGWQEIDIPLEIPRGFSWGGKGGSKTAFTHPIRFVELVLVPEGDVTDSDRKGFVVLDDVRVYSELTPEESVEVSLERPIEGFLTTEAMLPIRVVTKNRLDRPRTMAGKLTVTRLDGTPLSSDEITFTLPPNDLHEAIFELALPTRGYYVCTYTLMDEEGKPITRAEQSFGRVAQATDARSSSGFFGVCAHGVSEQSLADMRKLGVAIVRNGVQVDWTKIQPDDKDTFRFDNADRQAALHEAMGMRVMLEGGKNPKWLDRNPDFGTDLEAYLEYMRRVAEHFSGRGYLYEFWNEPDLSSWPGTPAEFGVLAEQACAVIKAADPTATVLFASTSGVDFHSGLSNFTFPALEAIGNRFPFDGLNVHPYCRPKGPDELQVREKLLRLRDWMDEHADGKPIWLGEIGWPTSTDFLGVSETHQAAYLAQIYIIGLSVDAAGVLWYKPTSSRDPVWHEMQYGYYRADGSPKPSALAFSQVAHRLDGLRLIRELRIAGAIRGYLFADDHRAVATVYSPGRSDITLVAEGIPPGIVEAFDGHPLDPGEVLLGDLPVYWMVDGTDGERLGEALEHARLIGVETPVSVHGWLDGTRYVIVIANASNRPTEESITIRDPDGLLAVSGDSLSWTLTLDGMQRETLHVPMKSVERPVRGVLDVHVSGQSTPLEVFAIPLHRYSEDADAPWRRDAVGLSREALFPPDMQQAWGGDSDLSAKLRWAWSPKGIHLSFSVLDDIHVPAESVSGLWRGDSLQVAIDLSPDGPQSHAVREIGFAVMADGKTGVWSYSGPQPTQEDVVAVVSRDDARGVTDYAITLGWDYLGTFVPEPNKHFPMSIQINENDGLGRKSWLRLSEGVGGEHVPEKYPVFMLQ